MIYLQKLDVPVWKSAALMGKLLHYYKESINIRTFCGFPQLTKHFDDLQDGMFEGCELEDGYIVVGETGK